jgi:hypothetical protein
MKISKGIIIWKNGNMLTYIGYMILFSSYSEKFSLYEFFLHIYLFSKDLKINAFWDKFRSDG